MNKYTNTWLDIIRSFAILFVLISHSRGFLIEKYPFLQFLKFGGFIGVELFFVLSGFLIGQILYKLSLHFSFNSLKVFFVRRWLRTLPNYYFYLFICLILSLLEIRENISYDFFKYLFFSQNLFSRHPSFFGEAWSLAIEEVFYIFFPIFISILLSFKIKPINSIIILGVSIIIFCTAYRLHLSTNPVLQWDADIRKIVFLRLDSIMIGVLASLLFIKNKKFITSKFLLFPLFFIFIFSIFYSGINTLDSLNSSPFAKSFLFNLTSLGCLGFLLIGYNLKFNPSIVRISNFFANISFSAYLSNLSIYFLINKFLIFDIHIKFIIFFPLVIITSYFSYIYLEQKILAYRDKKWV